MSNFRVENTDFGVRVVFAGFPNPEDVAQLNREYVTELKKQPQGFGILIDMRGPRAFSNEAAGLLKQQIQISKEHGFGRAAVILQSAIMTLQARRLAQEMEISKDLRFIDASSNPDWEATALDWIERAKEPGE